VRASNSAAADTDKDDSSSCTINPHTKLSDDDGGPLPILAHTSGAALQQRRMRADMHSLRSWLEKKTTTTVATTGTRQSQTDNSREASAARVDVLASTQSLRTGLVISGPVGPVGPVVGEVWSLSSSSGSFLL